MSLIIIILILKTAVASLSPYQRHMDAIVASYVSLQGKSPKLRGGFELNGKIRDQRDDLIRRRIEMKNSSENQLLGLQNQFDRYVLFSIKFTLDLRSIR